MKYRSFLPIFIGAIFLLFGAFSQAQNANQSKEPVLADRIVAVVNDDVITQKELEVRTRFIEGQLKKQGTPIPPKDEMQAQMLERLITDKVQQQFAKENGLSVDDAQLSQALERIAANNKLTLAQFRQTIEKDGLSFARFSEEIRGEILISRVREREVANKISVSEGEVDNFLAEAKNRPQSEYEVAHILFRAPESASPEALKKLKTRAETAFAKARAGENFAKLAATYSDAPDALQGGSLGKRSLDRLPPIFAAEAEKMSAGDIAPLLQSASGFHIMKLINKSGSNNLPAVEQTHAAHILVRANELVSKTDARHKIEGLAERVKHGENFAELARLFSQDGSASKGGDLGWIYPGDTVPEFERALNALEKGQVSGAIETPFGFHLIKVIERRTQDASDDRKRNFARQAIRERRMDDAYQDWIRQLRDEAHVKLMLEER